MARTIHVSDDIYKQIDALRQKYPGENRYESFNKLFVRILPKLKKVS
jgi:predicted CopG family antitoxin